MSHVSYDVRWDSGDRLGFLLEQIGVFEVRVQLSVEELGSIAEVEVDVARFKLRGIDCLG